MTDDDGDEEGSFVRGLRQDAPVVHEEGRRRDGRAARTYRSWRVLYERREGVPTLSCVTRASPYPTQPSLLSPPSRRGYGRRLESDRGEERGEPEMWKFCPRFTS